MTGSPQDPFADILKMFSSFDTPKKCKHGIVYTCTCGQSVRAADIDLKKLLSCKPLMFRCPKCKNTLKVELTLEMKAPATTK